MKFTAVTAALVGSALATPFSFPLSNGFPNPSTDVIGLIQQHAGGTLPNTPLPKDVTPDVVTALQLIAANEIFEVAYFTELYHNITNHIHGYDLAKYNKTFVVDAIHRIRAQEELHGLGANAILKSVGSQPIPPCKYEFPVTTFEDAIALANTFTDVVLGVLPQVQLLGGTKGGKDGSSLIPLIGSILGQEAEQDGWFRTLLGKPPSAAPFLTPTTPQFALAAVSMFLVPGSCPPVYNDITKKIGALAPLTVASISEQKSEAQFSVKGKLDAKHNALVYVSGQSAPVTVDIQNVQTKGGVTTFSAAFPYKITATSGFAEGLSVAAVTKCKRAYANVADVATDTLFGPGLIERH
ncbi:hypothetical protein FH972_026594 [Carpinus fangiana]|uniref:Late sexual development protein n=1 Tax=Carpinus fangiana TaxID=176857 RepID=A0A5N6L4G7_9ROSI|nr:hypothetical protein FH972_026594 [Carpinus fangiana]